MFSHEAGHDPFSLTPRVEPLVRCVPGTRGMVLLIRHGGLELGHAMAAALSVGRVSFAMGHQGFSNPLGLNSRDADGRVGRDFGAEFRQAAELVKTPRGGRILRSPDYISDIPAGSD